MVLEDLKKKSLDGVELSLEEAEWLVAEAPEEELYNAAHEITLAKASKKFDTCCIINAKSGRCGENCKWCAQSAHYQTGVKTYPFVGAEECLKQALENEKRGIGRFSIVNSGKKPANGKELMQIAEAIRLIRANSNIQVCASLGLLELIDLELLKDAGLQRYHCNLETSPLFFQRLCTTHTAADKIHVLGLAQSIGLDVCSGGIIGMGESPEDGAFLAVTLRILEVQSIPINILNPIKGTPLGTRPILGETEILRCIAMFRFVNPTAFLRFAGGRKALGVEGVKKALFIGINSAIMGDMLTTAGSKIEDDFELIKQAGYEL